MKRILSTFLLLFTFSSAAYSQTENQIQTIQIESISEKLTGIAKTLAALDEKLKVFSQTFSSNQGLKLSEQQQLILAAFEFLNRAEQRLATLQKLKIELSEKQSDVRLKLAEIEENLRNESIERSVAFQGTTEANELRESRRRVLSKEKQEMENLLNQIQNSLIETSKEVLETEMFLVRIRQRIFPAIEKEISDL